MNQVSDRHITSKLWTVIHARKGDNFNKLCAEMLFRLQWQIEKLSQELGFGPGFFSISPLRLDMIRYNQIWYTNVNRTQISEMLKTEKIDKSGFDLKQIYKRPTNWNFQIPKKFL